VNSEDLTHLAGRPLTPRERQCLALIAAEGFSYIGIAKALSLTPDSVRTYLARARAKLGANDRAHAMYLALKSGQLDVDTLGGALGYLALKHGLLDADADADADEFGGAA
jgi:DNA-binding CsgD family transcriptional regulator